MSASDGGQGGHLHFDFYGLGVCVRSRDPETARRLRRDFSYFGVSGECRGMAVTIASAAEGAGLSRNAGYWRPQRGRRLVFQDDWPFRLIRFADRAYCRYDYQRNAAQIHADDPDLSHEIAHYAILSRIGEDLDAQGWHRVHALGFSWGGKGAMALAPSGGGKSCLALAMLRRGKLDILSDDTPLLGFDLTLRAFPLRLGFREDQDLADIPESHQSIFRRLDYQPKRLVDIDFARGRIRSAAALRAIFIVDPPRDGATTIKRTSRPRALQALASHLVAGFGVPQMAEYMLNFRGRRPLKLAAILLRRLRTASRAAFAVPAFRLAPSRQPEECAQVLEAFLSRL